jgi:RHS repeat-associated protein
LGYDPSGRLYETSGGGATTRFLYDGGQAIGEYNTSGTLLRRYVPGPGLDDALAWYEGAGTSDRRWFVQDERGSVAAVADASGAALARNSYDEYGQRGASNLGRFQFTGQMWLPEAGVYHYRARAYSPTLGRFLQTDPILHSGGMNLYAYVHNDPLNFTDPWGLMSDAEFAAWCRSHPDECITVTAERPRRGDREIPQDLGAILDDYDTPYGWTDRLDTDGDGFVEIAENTPEAHECARAAQLLANINATIAGLDFQIRTANDANNFATGAATLDMGLRHWDTVLGGAVQRDLGVELGRGASPDLVTRARAAAGIGRIAGAIAVRQLFGAASSRFSAARSSLIAQREDLRVAAAAAGC